MNVNVTDRDRRVVEPVMEIAQTSDLPAWALSAIRERAATLVAMTRADGLAAVQAIARLYALADEMDGEDPQVSTRHIAERIREAIEGRRPKRIVTLHKVYPDGSHTDDCAGCAADTALELAKTRD